MGAMSNRDRILAALAATPQGERRSYETLCAITGLPMNLVRGVVSQLRETGFVESEAHEGSGRITHRLVPEHQRVTPTRPVFELARAWRGVQADGENSRG